MWDPWGIGGFRGGRAYKEQIVKKNRRKNRREKKFYWKWSEKPWELQEIPLKAKERIGNP